MVRAPALAHAVRLLLLGLLLCGVVLKPSLAIAEEMHELLAHAALVGDGHTHPEGHGVVTSPATADGDRQPHDDSHLHLTHCCGQQAAVLPRLEFALPRIHRDSPLPAQTVAFAPTTHAAPFRPPIQA
ncbi:hypothetical protein [Lysobacter auxotrophicus]|uniref:DUF2946 family protein n=1 Tax=Lysobacter auxotrophicus TaxID=2992573 RepID=A0ABM8D9K7_9GAMM|nr:hypothetical protein [Lysobacter auxotrophicus]BDU15236.1 DUF2946 family protein [Lysobacter auxotrophicus]